MIHIRGERFGMPAIVRAGCLRSVGTFPVEWSRHDGDELHFVFKGQMSWEIVGSKSPLRLSGGMFAIIPAQTRHRALFDQGSPSLRAGFLLDKHPERRLKGTGLLSSEMKNLLHGFSAHVLQPIRMSSRLRTAALDFADALRLENLSTIATRRHLRILTLSLLDEVSIALENRPEVEQRDPVITEICHWLELHASEPFDTQKLIKRSGYGRSRFFSLFLQTTGMTPRDYLTRLRIEKAKRALAETRIRKISAIAADCGFLSPAAFSTIFRKYVGLTPRAFAQNHG